MKGVVRVAVVTAFVGLAACGGSDDEKQKEQAQTAQDAAKGLEALAKGLGQAAGGDANQKPVDPVSFRDMQSLFPEFDGWTKEKPTGERMTSPFAFSQATGRYTKDNATIELKMVDSGFNGLLLAPYAMFLQSGYEKETSDGYEKSVQVAGQPGWEKWNSEAKRGELNALAGKRFLVQIEGSDIADTRVLHDFASKIDMNRLAALK